MQSESRFGGEAILNNSVQADTKFLRRIFMALVVLTLAAGGMVGFTTAQATTDAPAFLHRCPASKFFLIRQFKRLQRIQIDRQDPDCSQGFRRPGDA